MNLSNYSYQELAAKDKAYVWHPFTQMRDYCASDPIIIERAEGLKLIDVNGRSYYDGVSSIWLNVHGHQVAEIDQAIRDQLSKVAHSTLLGLGNVPSILLAEKLVELTPSSLRKVFYSDSGSEAVEIGLKIAYQYWRLKGENKRKYFVNMVNAYHGDTIGSTSVGGMDLFHGIYRDLLFETYQIPYPNPYRFDGSTAECSNYCRSKLVELLEDKHDEIAGLIIEPLVQGAAGLIMMPDGFLTDVAGLCQKYGILLLADEIATGFGRTGRMFACDHEDTTPDIMMIGKGLTGGYLPVAATLTSDTVYEAFLGEYEEQKTFFHGHSYTGNQLGCAAALANIELFQESNIVARVTESSRAISPLIMALSELEQVGDVRMKGLMIGVELVQDKSSKTPYPWEAKTGIRVCDRARELGMIIRPLGNVVVFMPPLTSAKSDLEAMVKILKQAIIDVTR